VNANALSVHGVSMRRRADYRRSVARHLTELDGALSLLRERLAVGDDPHAERVRKVFLALRERRRDLDVALEDLMRAPEEEWSWQKRELDDARVRLAELVDAALLESLVSASAVKA
jgi:hypothetical protein